MIQEDFNDMIEQMNNAVADSLEQNIEAQAAFMDSWTDAIDDSIPEEDALAEGIEGYTSAYQVWIEATEETFDRTTEILEGEDIDPETFRDLWLRSANEAFKEVMSTSAFATANGELVTSILELQREVDEATQDSLAQMGLPTQDDVQEVGERLVELERRQHEVEQKLDRILAAVEE